MKIKVNTINTRFDMVIGGSISKITNKYNCLIVQFYVFRRSFHEVHMNEMEAKKEE